MYLVPLVIPPRYGFTVLVETEEPFRAFERHETNVFAMQVLLDELAFTRDRVRAQFLQRKRRESESVFSGGDSGVEMRRGS